MTARFVVLLTETQLANVRGALRTYDEIDRGDTAPAEEAAIKRALDAVEEAQKRGAVEAVILLSKGEARALSHAAGNSTTDPDYAKGHLKPPERAALDRATKKLNAAAYSK